MWSRKPRPVAMRARPPPSRPTRTSMRVSRVARRTSPMRSPRTPSSAAGASPPASSASARSRRSLASRCETVTRKQSASSGSCANVRTAQPRSTRRVKRSGTGARASTKLPACASTSTPARAHAGGQPAALLDDRGAALLQLLGLVAGELGDGRRPRRDRPGRAQRVERLGERRLREAVADARGAEREALRERARDDEVLVARDQRREVLAAELEVGLVEHDDAGAGRADALDERGVELLAGRVVGAAEPDHAHVGGLAHELLAREGEARRRARARAPRRRRCGSRRCRAGRSAWRRARGRRGRARAARTARAPRRSRRRRRPGPAATPA